MDRWELENYLHEHILLSQDMGVEVVEATLGGVTLRAPLAPTINHRETVFGGSASAAAFQGSKVVQSGGQAMGMSGQAEQLYARPVSRKRFLANQAYAFTSSALIVGRRANRARAPNPMASHISLNTSTPVIIVPSAQRA